MQDPVSLIFEAVGGAEPFYKLVDEFYAGVEKDSRIRHLYPEDLSGSKKLLSLFLIQRCGGPGTYSQERGHPRMRARHMPFKIGMKERDAWLENMNAALAKTDEFKKHREVLDPYFLDFASFMINQPD